jgi:cobalt-zinc-cadmium efflux system outer membrane protein
VANSRLNPVFQLPFEYTTNHQGPGRPVTTGPAFDIPVETARKRENRVDQATYLSEAARLHVLDETWRVRSTVRDALVGMYAETKRSVMLGEMAGLRQQIVDILRRRERAGETARPDVIRAKLLLTQAQTELSTAKRALLDARARLAIAVGVPISALDAVHIDLDEFERTGTAPSAIEARRAAIFHRADLQGALAEYEASQAGLQLEVAKQYPDIHISLGYSYDVGANKISLGLAGVTLPFLDRNHGAIAQAQAKRVETAARVAALQDGIINDLEHALTRYRAGQDALRLSTTRQALARRQMDSQAASFAAGATDRLALALAKLDLQASKVDQLNEWVAMQLAAGMLEDAMQLPVPPVSTGISQPEREKAP